MITIGIDPGYSNTGLVMLQYVGSSIDILKHRTIEPSGGFNERMDVIRRGVLEFLGDCKHDLVVVEWPGFYVRKDENVNTKSVIKLHAGVEAVRHAILLAGVHDASAWPDISNAKNRFQIDIEGLWSIENMYEKVVRVTGNPPKHSGKYSQWRKKATLASSQILFPGLKLTTHEADAWMLAWFGVRVLLGKARCC